MGTKDQNSTLSTVINFWQPSCFRKENLVLIFDVLIWTTVIENLNFPYLFLFSLTWNPMGTKDQNTTLSTVINFWQPSFFEKKTWC